MPVAENAAAETTIRAVLGYAQIQENLGLTPEDAIATAIRETPDAEGMSAEGVYVYYTVVDTCLKGHLGDYEKKVVEPC